jgi:tetratricopeptide (TPR) repeat protein
VPRVEDDKLLAINFFTGKFFAFNFSILDYCPPMRMFRALAWTTSTIAFSALVGAPWSSAQQPAPPTQPGFDPSDVYYQAWLFTREAEALGKQGKHAESLAKLRSAEKFFETVGKFFPEWKKQMVTDRLAITQTQIAKVLPLAQAQQKKENVAIAEIEGGLPLRVNPLVDPNQATNAQIEDARVKSLENEVKRLREALGSPTGSGSRDVARAGDLQKQRDDLNARLKQASIELESLRARLATAPVQSEMDRMNSRLRSLEQEREAMGMALTQSREEQLKSLAKINTLTADYKAMRQQAADLENNLKIERKQSNEVTSAQLQQLQRLEATLKQKDADITAANNRVTSLQKELQESKDAFQELRTERDELLRDRDHMAALLKLSESGRIQQLIEQNMGLAKELREAKERVERINKDNDETKDELTEALRDLAITKSKIIALQTEKRAQDQRMSELELQLNSNEKSIASGKATTNDEEAQTLRDIIKRQLRVQERRKKAATLLLAAAKKQTASGDSGYDEAVAMLTDGEVTLTAEEQKILDTRHVDGEIYSPYAGSRERVGVATSALHEQIDNYTRAAVRAFSSQRLSASREVLEMILDIHPGHIPTMTKLGIVEMRLDDPVAATQVLRLAVENDETQPLSHRLLGLALYKTGDLANAEKELRRATEIEPHDSAGFAILGNTLLRMKRTQEAEDAYKKAIAIDPASAEALHNLALLCHRANRDAEARTFYQQALDNGAQPNLKLEAEIARKR